MPTDARTPDAACTCGTDPLGNHDANCPADRAAAYVPKQGGFLERNPHLIENYIAVCAELGEKPGEVPEEVGCVGRERPPEHVFEAFRRLHRIPEAGAEHRAMRGDE